MIPTFVLAQDDNEISFDTIVNDLSRTKATLSNVNDSSIDPFDNVQIHVGVGIANSVFTIQHPEGIPGSTQANSRGAQINLGIDLFSPNWVAEGGMVNYFESEYSRSKVSGQEFDLKLLYKNQLENAVTFKVGMGLAARYMDVTYKTERAAKNDKGEDIKIHEEMKERYTTPTTLAVVGADIYLAKMLSIGGEVLARNTLTNETPDQTSIDFTVRLDAHF